MHVAQLAGVPAPASNIWALYLRTMLLLHKCVQTRNDPETSDATHPPGTEQGRRLLGKITIAGARSAPPPRTPGAAAAS